jgi:two-component system, chemotaxis family, chemotaxis protein CheY
MQWEDKGQMPEYNVLIVEDSPTMRQLIAFALKRIRGVRIVEANDGVDGLKKLSSERFDLILTDINMPIMDGLKLVSLVRNDANYRSIPIVVITTEGAQEDRERALALGANDYITKPIQPTKILEVARNLLRIT